MAVPTHAEQPVSTVRALVTAVLAASTLFCCLTVSALAVSGPEYGTPRPTQAAVSRTRLSTAEQVSSVRAQVPTRTPTTTPSPPDSSRP